MSILKFRRRVSAWGLTVAAVVAGLAPWAGAGPQLLVCSSGNNTVQKFDLQDDQSMGAAASGGGISYPWGAGKGPDGHLYVSGFASHAVFRYDGTSGAYIDQFIPPQGGGLLGPGDLIFGDDGKLYISSMYSSEILRYDAQSGAFIDVFVAYDSGGLSSPRGIAFGPDGDLFVVNHYSGEVLRYDGVTGAFEGVFASFGFGDFDGDLAFGPDGHLYVTMYQDDAVARYDGQSGEFLDFFIAPFGFALSSPMGLAFGPDGSLYVASYFGAVTKHDAKTGDVLEYLSTGVFYPTMIVVVDDLVAGDIDGDGSVNINDLLAVINAWGPCAAPPATCPADVSSNGAVDVDDLLLVINNWSES